MAANVYRSSPNNERRDDSYSHNTCALRVRRKFAAAYTCSSSSLMLIFMHLCCCVLYLCRVVAVRSSTSANVQVRKRSPDYVAMQRQTSHKARVYVLRLILGINGVENYLFCLCLHVVIDNKYCIARMLICSSTETQFK